MDIDDWVFGHRYPATAKTLAVANLNGADVNATFYSFDIESITEDPFRRISGIVPAAQASYSLDQSLLNKTFEELDGRICKLTEYVKS